MVDAVMLDVVQQMEGLDISTGAVEVARQRAREAGVAARASFAVADLNQPSLQGPYDLVMFEQSLPAKYRIEPLTGELRERVARVSAAQVIAVDPSEAVHSSQIPAASAERFDVVEMREFGGTLLQFALAEIIANFDPDDADDVERLRALVRQERQLIESGAIGSDFVFAVYRKREPAPVDAMP